MLKRLPIIAAVFFLLTAFINPALAGTLFDESKAIEDALQNYGGYYKPFSQKVPEQDQGLHYITTTGLSDMVDGKGTSYGFLTYGQHHGDQKDGQSRYIGYTYYGEDYTNMDFPADQNAGGANFASQNWILEPWDNTNVRANNPQLEPFPGDGDHAYHTAILAGIMAYGGTNANNGYTISDSSNQAFWSQIERYVHILSPSTQYSWGIGRMWHKDASGGLWYVTVPIMPGSLLPEPANLKAVSIDLGVPPGQKAEPDTEYTATVVFENESAEAMPETPVAVLHGQYQATLYDENGQVLPRKTVGGKEVHVADFDKKGTPRARRTLTCKWHPWPQATDGLTAIINLDEIGKVHQEITYEDNRVSDQVDVNVANLVAVSINPSVDTAEPGQHFTAAFTVKNESGSGLEGVPVGMLLDGQLVSLYDESGVELPWYDFPDGITSQMADFAPGESKAFYANYLTALQVGQSVLTGAVNINPPVANAYPETTFQDNIITAVVGIRMVGDTPTGDGDELTFQAQTQPSVLDIQVDMWGNPLGPVIREPNTARFTDIVTATLRPNKTQRTVYTHIDGSSNTPDYSEVIAPPPPPLPSDRYCDNYSVLDSWEIIEATLTYPRQNPNFIFGNPLPSDGTITKDMDVHGGYAVTKFKEMWAMDGAEVYEPWTGRKVTPDPQYHMISTDYRIRVYYTVYQYQLECDPDDVCSCTLSYKYKDYKDYFYKKYGYLYIDGTGAVPLPAGIAW